MTNLSHTECLALKAIAIISIILHNFCHWLPGIAHENEFQFDIHYVDHLNEVLSNPDNLLPIHLLSFFGHYGVAVFVFLSGYGLVQKYEYCSDSSVSNPTLLKYIKIHYLKLVKLLIPGFFLIILWNLSDYYKHGDPLPALNHVIAQIGMYINFYPYPGDVINPGPYWFFGMILQLYVLYKVAIQNKHWSIPIILMVLCTTLQMFFNPESAQTEWLHYNFTGNMLPFGLGILAARHLMNHESENAKYTDSLSHMIKVKCLYGLLLIMALTLIYFTSLNYYTWFFTPVFAIISYLCLIKLLPGIVNTGLKYIGIISAGLFVFHPLARRWFVYRAQQGDIAYGLTMYLLVSVIGAILFTILWRKLPRKK